MSTLSIDDVDFLTLETSFQSAELNTYKNGLGSIDAQVTAVAKRIFSAKESELPSCVSQMTTCVKRFNALQQAIQQSGFTPELQEHLDTLQQQMKQVEKCLSARTIVSPTNNDQRMTEIIARQLAARGVTDQNFQRVNSNVKPPVVVCTHEETQVILTDSKGTPIYYSYNSKELLDSSSLEAHFEQLQIKMGGTASTLEAANFQFCSASIGDAAWEGREAAIELLTYEGERLRLENIELRSDRYEDTNSFMAPYLAKIKEAEDRVKQFEERIQQKKQTYVQKYNHIFPDLALNIIEAFKYENPLAAIRILINIYELGPLKFELEGLAWEKNYVLLELAQARYEAYYAEQQELERSMKDFENKCKGRDCRD